jgi:phosphohistidine phosphatase
MTRDETKDDRGRPMLRTLIIMRHAKSSWDNSALGDHERTLNARGRRSAPIVAQRLLDAGYQLERVISSDSTRTRETWEGMWSVFPKVEPVFTPNLYLGGIEEIKTVVSEQANSVGTILTLGHNPGLSMSVQWLTGEHVLLKTAYAAVVQSRSDTWSSSFSRGKWTLVDLITPKHGSE